MSKDKAEREPSLMSNPIDYTLDKALRDQFLWRIVEVQWLWIENGTGERFDNTS